MAQKEKTTLKLAHTAMMTALLAVFAQFALPFFTIPMTLQTFAVCLVGFLLGKYYGILSGLVYLALGAVGIPVFAGFQGSLGALLGPTGGFLFGFLPLVFLCGISTKQKTLSLLFPFTELILCHLFGVLWFSLQSGNSFFTAFLLSSAPYLIKDILSCILAKIFSKKLIGSLSKQKL